MTAAWLWRRPGSFRRGAACVLLLLVAWNVTAELAHRHGLALPLGNTSAHAVGEQSTSREGTKQTASGVCLLCQFQQQLAHGLAQTPPFALRPQTTTRAVVATTAYFLPTANALLCGRAPPLASLV
jgi:hypothetical protein